MAPWDGTGVMTKKQTTEIFHLAKRIGETPGATRDQLFKVTSQPIFLFYMYIKTLLKCGFQDVTVFLAEDRPFNHIKQIIQTRTKVVESAVQHVAAAVGGGATGKASKSGKKKTAPSVGKGAASGAAAGVTRAAAAAAAPAAAAGGAPATAAGGARAAAGGGARARGGARAAANVSADVSTSNDVEAALEKLFEQNSPEFYLGDCLQVIGEHGEWEEKITLLVLDPPFGVLDESHDVAIPATDVLRMCRFLLKKQGMIITYNNNAIANNFHLYRYCCDILFRPNG